MANLWMHQTSEELPWLSRALLQQQDPPKVNILVGDSTYGRQELHKAQWLK